MDLNRGWFGKVLLSILIGAALFGCVRTSLEETEHMPEMGTSVNSDGDLTINLTTEVGYVYTILYEDPRDRKTRPLPGAELIKGTGETIVIRKKVNPGMPIPSFRVEHSRIVE